ncbi:porin [Aquabacterium sp.]|uniref:porin n=1 Tax=Aquabacterium sp. TaxID=1872578 RepID=UPI003CFD1B6D
MFAKKTLVAAAALLAVAGAAQAQSSVKLYGYIEASVGSFEDFSVASPGTLIGATTSRATKVESGNMMTSYIGLSGSEDLGGGLKAEFVLESFLAGDTGSNVPNLAGGFWGRGSWVGLSGDFGRVALGQYDNAFFTMGLLYNPFGSSMTFSPSMVSYYSLGGFLAPSLGYDTGWVNSITYETPNFGGFTASLQFAPKETSAGGDAKNNYALSAAYNAGALSVMGVYTSSGFVAGTAYTDRQKNAGIGVSYDFGAAKLMAQYSQVKSETAGTDSKSKFFQVGATVPVTANGNVMVSYGQTKYEDGFLGLADGKLQQFSLGYDHSLSKRTGVYAALTTKKLKDAGLADDSANTFAVGLRHAF